jgi:hypothetical protein
VVVFFYSPNLIEETIKCFKEEDGLDISAETANEYLDALSGLFLVFAKETRPEATNGGEGLV